MNTKIYHLHVTDIHSLPDKIGVYVITHITDGLYDK